MKRLLLPVASALAIVLTAGGAGAASAPPAQRAAFAEAGRLLHAFVPPPGAVRPGHPPTGYRWPVRDPGQGVFGRRVDRRRFWLVHGSVHSVESLREKGWGSPSTVTQAGPHGDENTDLTFAVRGFGGRRTGRLLNVQAVRARGGGTLLRVDVVVVWRLSAAERESLPRGVRSIRIRGPHAGADVTDPAQVRTIVRWFDHLEILEPRFMSLCPYRREPIYRFAFRGARGGKLASALVPEVSGICSSISYSIRGHQENSLIGGDVVYRVQQLVGANWIGPPDVEGLANQRKAAAQREAAKLLHEFVPPHGATRTSQPRDYHGALERAGPTPYGEIVDVHRFWQTRAGLAAVASFEKKHGPRGLPLASSGVSPRPPRYETLSFSSATLGGRPPGRFLNITVMRLPTRTVVRVDALVTWIYPRSRRQELPAGVREVDIRAPKAPERVTDPTEVAKIVRWFDGLEVLQPGVGVPSCPLTSSQPVLFTFRSAAGAALAKATVPSGPASPCDEITFSIRGHRQTPLIDRTPLDGHAFVERVQRLLGVRFAPR